MGRVAVFVDSGYLYQAGSRLISGANTERRDCQLDLALTLDKLKSTANSRSGSAEFLRVYWYDGLLRNTLSDEQRALASSDGVKLRLGVVNSYGQQKGVDSRIVMDLVQLVRNGAITDALLLSGDEDVREILRISSSEHVVELTETSAHVASEGSLTLLDQVVDVAVSKLSQADLTRLAALEPGSYIPPEFDRPLLGNAGMVIARELESDERKYLRRAFLEKVREHHVPTPPPNTA